MAMVKDVVCGMEIESERAAATADYEGTTYFFCSESCHQAFLRDPSSFVS